MKREKSYMTDKNIKQIKEMSVKWDKQREEICNPDYDTLSNGFHSGSITTI